jgi:hypothetical protein
VDTRPPAVLGLAGLAIVGQMHGLILWAERSGLLRPPIIWFDRRASAEVADYQRLPADVRARLGNARRPAWPARCCSGCPGTSLTPTGGAWIGLTLAHQRDDLMRAAL